MAEKVKQYRLPDAPITLDELKSFLWAAATHLRGQIDAAGYNGYFLRLGFLLIVLRKSSFISSAVLISTSILPSSVHFKSSSLYRI